MDKKWLIYGGFFLAGALLSSKVLSLPGLKSLPKF
jgi:hypothetical protein